MDSRLYKKVRSFLEDGLKVIDIHKKLGSTYSAKDIDFMITEYYKDESTDYDDEIIHYIKNGLKKGGNLLGIYDTLAKKGHPPFEINKAIMRVEVNDSSLVEIFKIWKRYTYFQVSVTSITLLLAVFYSYWFFIPLVVLIIMYVSSSLGIPSDKRKWIPEITVLPGMRGVGYACGFWGYNPLFGNYFRWWTLSPISVTISLFVVMGFVGIFILKDTLFAISCLLLLIFGSYTAIITPKKDEKISHTIGRVTIRE